MGTKVMETIFYLAGASVGLFGGLCLIGIGIACLHDAFIVWKY